ncbi:NADH-quinone oxidoreductase subunit K [Sulfurovum sp.]|uniref:NADH-quinone oxidoreductase subunit NuoK n=1 Tax=Sulfurovum sp. TaxID=1969726 RepID=UPI0025CD24FE|nr:NADH-quinone oxidoreductase subunit K [Sulfurovum sp.]
MFSIEMFFAIGLFTIGLYGVSSGRDFLRIFFSLEMLLNAVIMMLATTAHHLGMTENIVLAYMVMILATLEAAAGVLIFAVTNKITGAVIPDEIEREELS